MASLPGVQSGLLCHDLDGQVLIYNPRTDTVHLLDPTTARVLDLLQRCACTKEEIIRSLPKSDDIHSGAVLLELALRELKTADLLDQNASSAEPMAGISRRELLRKVTLTGAAATLIPTIVTLSATRLNAQQASCLPKKACCTADVQCCSNKCDAPTPTGCTTGTNECH